MYIQNKTKLFLSQLPFILRNKYFFSLSFGKITDNDKFQNDQFNSTIISKQWHDMTKFDYEFPFAEADDIGQLGISGLKFQVCGKVNKKVPPFLG